MNVDRDWIIAVGLAGAFGLFLVYKTFSRATSISYNDLILSIPIIIVIGGLYVRNSNLVEIDATVIWLAFAASAIVCLGFFYLRKGGRKGIL